MEQFKLAKPDLSKINREDIFVRLFNRNDFRKFLDKTNDPVYLYWDKVKYHDRPSDMTATEYWALVKMARQFSPTKVQSLVKNQNGQYFTWQSLPRLYYQFHEIDMGLGGNLMSSEVVGRYENRRQLLAGMMEEAIASSQLEGANTTRKAAKRLIQEKRKPKDDSERMVLNTYLTNRMLEEEHRHSRLDKSLLLRLHQLLMEGTKNPEEIGRFRRDSDQIVVTERGSNIVLHSAPKEGFLNQEMDRLLAYANDELSDSQPIHPLVKAIIIHFWMGYLHPFTDGNGRLARALFYWYLLKNDYWAFTYLPLSRVIKGSPKQYAMAYIYSEQDDSDLTYFIDYNVRKIQQARKDFELYIERKRTENASLARAAKTKYDLNSRQLELLRYYRKNADVSTNVKTHTEIYQVSRITAMKDLKDLESKGLVVSRKSGKEVNYFATGKLNRLFE